jgi:hypothetical protein
MLLHFPHRHHDHDEEERHMDEWHDFFLAQAGAAGVLTGLVFVAVSINLQQIVSDPGSGLAGRAAEALILLVGVLTASVLLLVPGQGQVMVGSEVLLVGLLTWGCVVTIQLLRLRSWGHEARPAPALRAARGAGSDRYVTVGGGRHRCAGRGVRGSILACGGHDLLDPGGIIRGMGVARGDQSVREASGFSPPYSPQCLEGKF